MRQGRSISRNALTKRWVYLRVAAWVLAWGGPCDAADVGPSGFGPWTFAWSYASFQAVRLGNRVTADIWMTDLPGVTEQAGFLQSPRGTAFKPSGRVVVKLSVAIRIDIIGRGPVRLENHVWFDPKEGTPLYLIRTRMGLDDYYQQFRFTQEGVFRRQREPASAAEAAGSMESWTKRGEHFYAYPPADENCHAILETSTLIYLLSASAAKQANDTGELCVFHKRQLHRVSLQTGTAEAVGFDFLEKKGAAETRRSGSMPAQRIRIESRPIGSYRGQVEDFFRDGTHLVLSIDGSLPLIAICDLPLIGRVEMKLKEIHLK
jgi:hypothetical protein